MSTLFPGELQHYEGTTAQCDGEQEVREIFYDNQSGTLRYKTIAGDIVYFERVIGGESGYIPKFLSNTSQGNSIIYESGVNVGIGTITPLGKLSVSQDNNFTNIDIQSSTISKFPLLTTHHCEGTISAPTGITNNKNLFVFRNYGFGTTQYNYNELYTVRTVGNWTDTSAGCDVFFSTTPNGSITSTERLRITHSGNIGIGTGNNPLDKLDVNGNIRSSGTILGQYKSSFDNAGITATGVFTTFTIQNGIIIAAS